MNTQSMLFLTEGDAETWQSWSGCAHGLVRALRQDAWNVRTSDVLPSGLERWALMGRAFHPRRKRWAARYHFGSGSFHQRSARASDAARTTSDAGVIIQAGATFDVSDPLDRPRFVYCDANAVFAAQSPEYSSIGCLTTSELDAVIERERSIYQRCDGVFTFSECLRQSLIRDFGLSPDRVWPVYVGANLERLPGPPTRGGSPPSGPPTILFVGKDFERKGGADLLNAFDLVRAQIPDSRLVLVGRIPEIANRPGVDVVGELRREDGGLERLGSLYGEADLFCMPSRYEPFGVVFLEAMLHGVPCVGTTDWAMPEIIQEGETGWLARPRDIEDLAARLIEALGDRSRLRAMGVRAYEVASTRFTWDAVVQRMTTVLDGVAATTN